MVKVVQRLRKSLEPERQRSDNYIEDVPGTGYRLRNYKE
jgi:DNA-binding response OmpR family regulator